MRALGAEPFESSFMSRFARELESIAVAVHDLQGLQTFTADSTDSGLDLRLQSLDELSQRIHAMALVAVRLADVVDDRCLSVPSILAGLTLSRLSDRLSGLETSAIPSDGEFEMF